MPAYINRLQANKHTGEANNSGVKNCNNRRTVLKGTVNKKISLL